MQLYFCVLLGITSFTTAAVYYVEPDDGESCPYQHCHVLQYYANKLLDSYSQLHFLSGTFHLSSDFVLSNAYNISLTGSRAANSTPSTVIQCKLSVSIVMINITGLTMKDMEIKNCGASSNAQFALQYISFKKQTVTLTNCSSVNLHNLIIRTSSSQHGLLTINVMGYSLISEVTCNGILVVYNDVQSSDTRLNISAPHFTGTVTKRYRVTLMLHNSTKPVQLKVSHVHFSLHQELSFFYFNTTNTDSPSKIEFFNCSFHQNQLGRQSLFLIAGRNATKSTLLLTISNSHFISNKLFHTHYMVDVQIKLAVIFSLKNSEFRSNYDLKLISFSMDKQHFSYSPTFLPSKLCTIHVRNTKFVSNIIFTHIFNISQATLKLEEQVLFLHNYGRGIIALDYKVFGLQLHGLVGFHGNDLIEVLYDTGTCSYEYFSIAIYENSNFIFTNNRIYAVGRCDQTWMLYKGPQSPCVMQFYSERGNLDNEFNSGQVLNYSIIFERNLMLIPFFVHHGTSYHCSWRNGSAFHNIHPSDVYQKYFVFSHDLYIWKIHNEKRFCVCHNDTQYDCYKDQLGPIYPGETLYLLLYKQSDKYYPINAYYDATTSTQCKVIETIDIQLAENQCTKLNFTILFNYDEWCELFVKESLQGDENYGLEKFFVKFLAGCPMGFVKYTDKCECDRTLTSIGISTCDINQRAILRPANSWISASTNNHSKHNYTFSENCPLDYCLPHSSYVNLSNPDSQCQFNRSGLLCGHCQQHLSTTFASSQCQHCSNVYLLLIIPFALLGALLVYVMFTINLTVTEGTVNAFVLYVNIASINDTIFFPLHQFSYVFISVANLDFGIQVCFYNGMDDFVKMWLQLVFPLYLILISVSLIITSRYSTTIQRLTARRALPVLATLFLLSFTKILQTVTKVLFSYSEVVQIPTNSKKLIWSVDSSIPLLGVKFTTLFVVCLILFFIMFSFVIIVTFARPLLRFKIINKFKPLLDAYQGAYIDKCHYWTGLQLVLRAVFFGVSSLDRNTNLIVGTTLLNIMIGVHGIVLPYKRRMQNYQELFLLCNLHGLYISALFGTNMIIANGLIILVFVQFCINIIYQIMTHTRVGSVIGNQQASLLNSLTCKIRTLYSHREVEPYNLGLNIPDKTYNYRDYQEPLVEYCH